MKRKRIVAVASALTLGALLAGGALALEKGDSLVSLQYLQEHFLPIAQSQAEQAAEDMLLETYDQAVEQAEEVNRALTGQSGGGVGGYSESFQSREFARRDIVQLPTGSGVLMLSGSATVVHAGSVIDVTQGTEVPSGGQLAANHRYLVGEDTTAAVTVRSGIARLGLQGAYTYSAGGLSSYPFVDVSEDDWFSEAVDYVYRKGLFAGTGEDTFGPQTSMTRAMMVTVFYRLAGSPENELGAAGVSFADVGRDSWYYSFVGWGAAQGVTAGMGDNLFAPDASVTRQQVLVMLYGLTTRYMGLEASGSAELSAYTDGSQVADWARQAVSWAVSSGVLQTTTGQALRPNENATRAEVADILMEFSQRYL